ncbi:MAG: sodium:proton antiporter [Chloroflexi bacterium]|nr:sodium:proton antiporter [Chloroflexota bacterium]
MGVQGAAGDVEALVWLLMLALLIAAVTRRFAVPYTVALAAAGFALGLLHLRPAISLTQDSIFLVFLPVLLFQAAVELPWNGLRANLLPVLALAVGGVVLNLALVGAGTHFLLAIPTGIALVFGAIVAATDPVAVVALFRGLRLVERLTLLIEAESLFNDGLAATLYLTVVGAALGSPMSVAADVLLFLKQGIGGVVVGLLLGWLMSFVTGHLDDLLIETAMTLVLAYGSYLVAAHLGVSGMLSVVAAGIVVGSHGLPERVHPEVCAGIKQFWEFVAFIANSLLFLLLGFQTGIVASGFHWRQVLILTALVLLCRAFMVFVLLGIVGLRSEPVPVKWRVVLTWGGLRGAVAMALSLGLPAAIPHRAELQGWILGTTMISLLVQGVTVKPLVRWMGIAREA